MKKYSQFFIWTLFLIIIIIGLLLLIKNKPEILFGSIISILTMYFGIIRYMIENDKMFKELFNEFNTKYDQKFNNFINDLNYFKRIEPLNQAEINLIIDYFNLCSEEYLWYSKRRIPKKVWKAWKAGILQNLEIPVIREIYKQEILSQNSIDSYYGLIKELGIY